MKLYRLKLLSALKDAKQAIPTKLINPAAKTASLTDILPEANGRSDVLAICLSTSFSSIWLSAFAAPVTKNPPKQRMNKFSAVNPPAGIANK